jgi:hypothetical protein
VATLVVLLVDGILLRTLAYATPATRCLSGLVFAALAVGWCLFILSVAAAAFGTRRLAFTWLSKGLTMTVPALVFLLRPFGLSRDRISSSCIAVTNRLARLRLQVNGGRPRPMVLLPRCLTRESVRGIRKAAAEFDCPVFVVGTNRQARARIREFRPSSIVAVACERDLVRGLSEYSRQIPILVIANQRPKGPCLDATVDLGELTNALRDLDTRPEQDAPDRETQMPQGGRQSVPDTQGNPQQPGTFETSATSQGDGHE